MSEPAVDDRVGPSTQLKLSRRSSDRVRAVAVWTGRRPTFILDKVIELGCSALEASLKESDHE